MEKESAGEQGKFIVPTEGESLLSEQGEETASFEGAYGRLEQIVKQLEEGDVSLAESLRLFEEGIALARGCAGQLDRAETKIRLLLEQEDGTVQEVPLDEQPGA